MTAKLQRPLLLGGSLLIIGTWVLETLNHALGEWGVYALVAGLAGAGVWWLQKQSEPKATLSQLPLTVDSTIVKRALAEAEKVITHLAAEAENPEEPACVAVKPQISLLQSQVAQITAELARKEIRFAVMGSKGVGKTSLIQALQAEWATQTERTLTFTETPSFSATTTTGLAADTAALQQAIAADLVLFLITADLTEAEFQTVKRLAITKRTLLVFNKQDQYPPTERETILNQLQKRGHDVLRVGDVVAIAAVPNPIKVRQHQSDGLVNEWLEDQRPNLAALTQRLDQILQQESQQLVLASSLGNAISVKAQAKTALNSVRRTRALPVVEQFQWLSAAAAFASPLPTVDVLATAAINGQMILDLGAIYRQKLSLQQAQKVAATLGSLMLKLGFVELSTQTIVGFMKTNAITYVAGGCIQGISAAYLTRVAGLSLIEYFNTQEPNLTLTEANPLAIERLSQVLQTVFQRNQQTAFLQAFVGQALHQLTSLIPQSQSATAKVDAPLALPATLNSPLSVSLPQQEAVLEEAVTSARLSLPSLHSSLPSP